MRCAAPTQIICADMSALPDNCKIKPQQRLFFLLILLFGLPAHFLPLIRFFCFKHSHSLFHFSLFHFSPLLITYFGALAQWERTTLAVLGSGVQVPYAPPSQALRKKCFFALSPYFISKTLKKSTKSEKNRQKMRKKY